MDHNTKEGIALRLGSYSDFYDVMRLRYEQGSYRPDGTEGVERGKLTPFTVLGRFLSDQFGQCWRLNREIFTDADRATMPAVMTSDEMGVFFDQVVLPRITDQLCQLHEGHSGAAPAFPLPPPHVLCASCGKSWELAACHEIEADSDFEDLDLGEFVGKTICDVEVALAARQDALRQFAGRLYIQNPQWADPDPHRQRLGLSKRDHREVARDYVIQQGDHIPVFRYHFYHGPCFRALENERAIAEEAANVEGMKQMLEQTGFEDVRIARVSLPEHLRKWVAADLDEDESVDDVAAAFAYYRVETKQGSFGIAVAAYPALDLEGSGVSLQDLEPQLAAQLAAEMPSDFPPIVGLTGEPTQLLRLWQLLVKHQTKK